MAGSAMLLAASAGAGAAPDPAPAAAGQGTAAPAEGPGKEAEDGGAQQTDGAASEAPARDGQAWYWRTMDVTHRSLSRGIEGTAKGIDAFFASEEALQEATGSFVKLRFDANWIESRGDKYQADVDARLDLPGTEDRLQLLVESDPAQTGAEDDPLADSPGEAADDEEGLAVAVEAWLEGERAVDWQLRPALGIRGGLPLNPFARFRAIRRHQYAKWDSRFAATLVYFYQDGLIFSASKDFDRPLSDTLVFRTRSAYQWRRKQERETFQETLSLFKTLTERRRVAYEVGLTADDQPGWALNEYFARIRYRQRVYKHWLFAELQPRVRWPKATNYDHEAALIFRLEAVFGERSLRRSRRDKAD
jgi:hypothetical protein